MSEQDEPINLDDWPISSGWYDTGLPRDLAQDSGRDPPTRFASVAQRALSHIVLTESPERPGRVIMTYADDYFQPMPAEEPAAAPPEPETKSTRPSILSYLKRILR